MTKGARTIELRHADPPGREHCGPAPSRHAPVHPFLRLQHAAGNAAVQRLARSGCLQTKLAMGLPEDEYEQEADRVADAVMRMPERNLGAGRSTSAAPSTQRMCADCQEERRSALRLKAADRARPSEVPPIVHEVLRSPGRPLDSATRALMESRFRRDFNRVRVHTDAKAAESAQTVNALAYTVGSDIVFGEDQYDSGTTKGKRLLAHELTHVVQQADTPISMQPGSPLVSIASRKRPSLQRTTKFVEGTVSEEFNLAERVLNDQFAGNTDFLLNGSTFTDLEEGLKAFSSPSIDSSPRATKGVDCWFDSVPNNEVSFAMQILKSGPWSFETTKAKIADRFSLGDCQAAGGGKATLVVEGKPTDEAQRKRTRTHEDHHVDDYKSILNDIIVPWDKRMTETHSKQFKMAGTDKDDCVRKLYVASAGAKRTPDDIVTTIITSRNDKAKAFHATEAGRNVKISNPKTDKDCNTVTTEAR